ncbi:MAG: U32 family peptidase [Bacteroidaceae bacterium]|nr:U32 family peptidase [Bacteroidaceae bacterium]
MKYTKQTLPIPPLKGERPSKSPLKGDFFSSPLRGGREGSGSQRGSIELLSPARDLACGIAAIDHGADAVYIGASRFGARAAAGNSVEDIKTLCDYAHRFGAKVYVTLNTLLRPDELEQARLIAWDLYHAGADALIIQDMALCSLPLGGDGEGFLPPIPLHASTQMDNRTAEKVAWLCEQGFEQIVLARELTLNEIRDIHQAVPQARLEVFVHGALCVSYSGRCDASEYCFGRSANRGECAQFCRLPFSLEDAEGRTLIKDKYLLSLRDMNRLSHLEAMMDAGVRSFKIEGRLKDIGYVKNVTAAYRQAIDAILKRRPEYVRSSFGTSTFTFQPDLSRSFSRGSTDYFLFGRTNDLASPDTPKSKGREVGFVKEVRRDSIVVSSSEAFSNGDGLCFFDEEGHLQGFRVNRVAYPRPLPKGKGEVSLSLQGEVWKRLRKGTRLWRSFDKGWEDLMSGHTAERRIAACFLLEETQKGFRLTFTAEDGTKRSEEFEAEHQLARTDQTSSIKEVLSKLGDTPYLSTDVEVRFSQPWFIPRSILAEWRRKIIDHSPLTIDHLATPETALNDNSQCPPVNSVMFNGQCSMVNNPLMTCRFCLRHAWGQCKKEKTPHPPLEWSMVNGQWLNGKWQDPLYLVLGDGRRFRLEFDCKKCEMLVLR